MSNRSDFALHEAAIRAIAADAVARLVMPAGTYSQEADDLAVWAAEDLGALTARGLDPGRLDELSTRNGAFRHAQSLWSSGRCTGAEARRRYAALAPVAYELRARLVHEMLFAYRDRPDLRRRVREVAAGSGDADLIQDLLDLSVHGRKNPEPLAAIRLDAALLDEAEETSATLASLLASARGERAADAELKRLRGQAYTHLKAVVDEVRELGRFVFWRDEARLAGYGSAYLRGVRRRNAAKAAVAPEDGPKTP